MSLRLGIALQLKDADITPEAIDWLEKVEPVAWKDDLSAKLLVQYIGGMLARLEGNEQEAEEKRPKLERLIAVLKKAELGERMARPRYLVLARQALLGGDAEAFLSNLKQALDAPAESEWAEARGSHEISMGIAPGLIRWKTTKGEEAYDSLVDRLPSPALRCLADLAEKIDKATTRDRIEKEIAALPADAPRETRRELIRLRWQYRRGRGEQDGFQKMMQAAADEETDARLALEALVQLSALGEKGRSFENQRRMEALSKRLMASNDSDRLFAQQLGLVPGRNSSQVAGPVTRWGAVSHGSNYYGHRNSRSSAPIVRRIAGLEDRQVASREAADFLEREARGAMGQAGMVQDALSAFREAGILNDALGKITLPEDAGLSRRVAVLLLMESSGRTADAKAIVGGIHRMRPWDIRWAVKLAFLTDAREEAFRLLDEASKRPDFAREFLEEFLRRGGSEEPTMEEYAVLADWAERPQTDRSWLGAVTVELGTKVTEYGANAAGQGKMLDQ
ncbi:MAG TPA: hypothetical protein VGE67_06720, partial [Haloferula sp.]